MVTIERSHGTRLCRGYQRLWERGQPGDLDGYADVGAVFADLAGDLTGFRGAPRLGGQESSVRSPI